MQTVLSVLVAQLNGRSQIIAKTEFLTNIVYAQGFGNTLFQAERTLGCTS